MRSFILATLNVTLLVLATAACFQFLSNTVPEERPYSRTTIKIAIIDTGYDIHSAIEPKLKLCPYGHFDFSNYESKVGYSRNHGTIVASIIARKLKMIDYCAIIYRVERGNYATGFSVDPHDMAGAIDMAAGEKAVAINISLSGPKSDDEEAEALKNYANTGGHVFLAAGNNRIDLARHCDEYPACYTQKNTTITGALDVTSSYRAKYSNFGIGKVNSWYSGTVYFNGVEDTGTSYASPRALSSYVLSRYILYQEQTPAQKQ